MCMQLRQVCVSIAKIFTLISMLFRQNISFNFVLVSRRSGQWFHNISCVILSWKFWKYGFTEKSFSGCLFVSFSDCFLGINYGMDCCFERIYREYLFWIIIGCIVSKTKWNIVIRLINNSVSDDRIFLNYWLGRTPSIEKFWLYRHEVELCQRARFCLSELTFWFTQFSMILFL